MIDSSSPNQPIQNYEVVNPTLETQVRTLLPSVAGYGGNLRSTNTIIPIVDLTSAAEGATLPNDLSFAVSRDGDRFNRTTSGTDLQISNSVGWSIARGNVNYLQSDTASGAYGIRIYLDDTVTEYDCFVVKGVANTSVQSFATVPFEFIYYNPSGFTLRADVDSFCNVHMNVRQIADKNETLVSPTP